MTTEGVPFLPCYSLAAPVSPSLVAPALPRPSPCLPCRIPRRVCLAASLVASASPCLPCRVPWSSANQRVFLRPRIAKSEETCRSRLDATQRKSGHLSCALFYLPFRVSLTTEGVPFLSCCSLAAPALPSFATPASPCLLLCLSCRVPRRVYLAASAVPRPLEFRDSMHRLSLKNG